MLGKTVDPCLGKNKCWTSVFCQFKQLAFSAHDNSEDHSGLSIFVWFSLITNFCLLVWTPLKAPVVSLSTNSFSNFIIFSPCFVLTLLWLFSTKGLRVHKSKQDIQYISERLNKEWDITIRTTGWGNTFRCEVNIAPWLVSTTLYGYGCFGVT